MVSRIGVPGGVTEGVTGDIAGGPLRREHYIGMDTGVSVCVVTEFDVDDVGGVVLFPSLSSGDDLSSGVVTISRVTGDRRRC